MTKLKEITKDEFSKKFIEYNALITINNTIFADGLINERLRDRISEKLKKDYKSYRSA